MAAVTAIASVTSRRARTTGAAVAAPTAGTTDAPIVPSSREALAAGAPVTSGPARWPIWVPFAPVPPF
ncbi:hypothetical protein [Mycobacterium szulgai]|uniref:hypothetical protein n=1 Tax=Mycobacterium szulgai TaxID=1787 RepID=UPI0021F2BE80|nr:hypothetical protein [Mycobacterium szulgai]MCV7078487.1 hypothetical protein [Mycobacterium szulgai]